MIKKQSNQLHYLRNINQKLTKIEGKESKL